MDLIVNNVRLSVAERGTGEPAVVLLHYWAGSGRAWDAVMDHLAADYRCIAPDLRGFGASDAPARGYGVARNADDIAALIDALALGRYVLVGHSMGGKFALALAARQPAGLQGLVLVAPSPPTPEPMEDADRTRLLRSYGERDQAEHTAQGITARPLPPDLHEQVVVDNLRASRAAWDAWLEEGNRENITDLIGCIDVPAIVLSGESDTTIKADVLRREVLPRLADASLSIVPDAAHLLPLENPAAVAAAIREMCNR